MPIPAFVDGTLPPGPHLCGWEELESRFGGGEQRRKLTAKLREFVDLATHCGFAGIAVGGSFASSKTEPGDLDLLFITHRNLDKGKLSVKCAQLLEDDATFKRRTGHNALNCPDEPDVLSALIFGLGFDVKTGKDRGMLLLRLV